MKGHARNRLCRALALTLLGPVPLAAAGTWTRVVQNAPAPVNTLLLLSDGTVMAAHNSDNDVDAYREWYRLTPDAQGSYVNGTWSTLAPMADSRLYYASQVLRDGRVFVAGGEYGTGFARAEVYDPLTNAWTPAPIPTSLLTPGSNGFSDSCSEILPDGRVMIMPVYPRVARQTLIYDPGTNLWAAGPLLFRGTQQSEATWVKLADESFLTVDPYGTNSERFIPSMNAWVNDAVVPTSLYDPYGHELGGAALLADGRALFLGSTGHTAIYTPSGSASPGTWVAGPDIPGAHGTPDAPLAMMVTGNVLCAVSPIPTSGNHFPSPTSFYEYLAASNQFVALSGPTGATQNMPCYRGAMLTLPDGNVLYSYMTSDLWVYHPDGPPLAAGRPVVQSLTRNPDGSYHLAGTGFNGLSEGASFGDDLQMNSNYPLVRMTGASGAVRYARTYNWSSTGVMTGSRVVTTEYRVPVDLPADQYTLRVVANGFESDPFCTTPWVTTPPAAQRVCPGGRAVFTLTASGSPTLTYQWRRNGVNLAESATVRGVATASLTIDPADDALAGLYTCVVANACGEITGPAAVLTLKSPDLNDDGNADQDDLLDLIHVIAGGGNPGNIDPDLNDDGNADQDDVAALVNWLAGGGCP